MSSKNMILAAASLFSMASGSITPSRYNRVSKKEVRKTKAESKKCKSCKHYKYWGCNLSVFHKYEMHPLHVACDKYVKRKR